jgi:hypothetical protein
MATAADFRRIALSLPSAEQGSHHGQPDFRINGRIFATLSMADQGYGNLMLTPEVQADFVADAPKIFVPIHGGWGRMGHTHLVLAAADEETIRGALQTAYNLRVAKNSSKSKPKSRKSR